MIHAPKHILWATDFSEESQEALHYADLFAKTFKARLTAMHVVPDFSAVLYEAWPEAQAELTGQIEMSMARGRDRIGQICDKAGICPDKVLVSQGDAARSVVDAARAEGADLIVVGRRGTTGREPGLVGGVTHRILRGSHVPVLVTKGTKGRPAGIKSILVPTDFSGEDVERDHAWTLAKGLQAGLTFLYVVEVFGHDLRLTDEMFAVVLGKLRARKRREHEDVAIAEDVTKAARAWDGIVNYADLKKADLIVMSTTVRPLTRMFLGSTTEKVIAHSDIPVYAIPRERG